MTKLIKAGLAIAALWYVSERGKKNTSGDGLWPAGVTLSDQLDSVLNGVTAILDVCSPETGKCAHGEAPGGESEGDELADEM